MTVIYKGKERTEVEEFIKFMAYASNEHFFGYLGCEKMTPALHAEILDTLYHLDCILLVMKFLDNYPNF